MNPAAQDPGPATAGIGIGTGEGTENPVNMDHQRVLAVLGALRAQGWVGRRDRALLVLAGITGLSYADIAELTVGDVTVTDGTATIRTRRGTALTLTAGDDPRVCGPCILARWLHLLDLAVIHPDGRVVTAVITRAAPPAADAPHACRTDHPLTFLHPRALVLPAVDQWGPLHPTARFRRDTGRGNHPDTDPDPAAADRDSDDRARRLERRAQHLLTRGPDAQHTHPPVP